MNNIIKIEDISTYPNSLLKYFEKEKEGLYNTFENKNVVLDSSTYLYKQIDSILSYRKWNCYSIYIRFFNGTLCRKFKKCSKK